MGLFNILFGKPKPPPDDGKVGCFNCRQRAVNAGGNCPFCYAAFATVASCFRCGWRHGVGHPTHYTFVCQGCGEDCASLAVSDEQVFEQQVQFWMAEGYTRAEAEDLVRHEQGAG
jgi:hypothetical protein